MLNYRQRLLLIVSLGLVWTNAVVIVFSPILPEIREAFGISPTLAGFAITVIIVLQSISRYPGGRYADALNRKTVLVCALIVTSVGCVLIFGPNYYPILLIAAIGIGIGSGLFRTATAAVISDNFEARRGFAFGIYEAAISLGGLSASGIAITVHWLGHWEWAFVILLVGFALLTASMHFFYREPYIFKIVNINLIATSHRLWKDPKLRLILVAVSFYSIAWHGSITFYPTYLQEFKTVSPSLSAYLLGLLFALGIGVNLIAGALGDRLTYSSVSISALISISVGILMLVFLEGTMWIILSTLVLAIGLGSFWPVIIAIMMDIFQAGRVGTDYGAMTMVISIIGAMGPTLVGFIADISNLSIALLSLLPILALSTGSLIWLIRLRT